MFAPLLDDIEQHDDVTHDNANETGNAKDRQETHGHVHDPDTGQSARGPERDAGEYD